MIKNTFLLLLVSIFTMQVFAQEPTDTTKVEDVTIDDINIEDIEIDDIDDIDSDDLGQRSTFPWDKFSVGGQFGSPQFGNTFSSFNLSPELVYHLNDNISFGVDGIFERTAVKRIWNGINYVDANYKQTNTGGRVFSRYQPVSTLPVFAQVEYEALNTKNPYYRDTQSVPNQVNFLSVKQQLSNFNAGIGMMNGPYYIGLMYNFMNKENKEEFDRLADADISKNTTLCPTGNCGGNFADSYPYNGISFRTGLNIRLGQGEGRNKQRKKQSRNKKRRTE